MFKVFIFGVILFSFISCRKSDFKNEDTFIHVFESKGTLAKQTFDEGIILLTKEGNSSILYRINREGLKLWRKDLNNLFSTYTDLSLTTLTACKDGSCLLGGNYFIDTSTYFRSVLFFNKIDKDGNTVFQSSPDTLFTAGVESPEDIVQTNNGDWAAIVNQNHSSNLVRINQSGLITLNQQISKSDYWKKIICTADGGFAALGYANYTYSIFKFDSGFTEIWSREIFPIVLADSGRVDTVTTIVSDFIETPMAEFLICGHSSFLNGSSLHQFDFFVKKLNAAGDSIFTKTYSNPYNDFSKNIILTGDQKILITGTESSLPYEITYKEFVTRNIESSFYKINSSSRCFVIKLNSNLDQIWAKSYGNGFGSDGLITVERSDGSYLICGNQVSYGNKNALSLFTLKALKNGNLP